jgi:hypothetical protein
MTVVKVDAEIKVLGLKSYPAIWGWWRLNGSSR